MIPKSHPRYVSLMTREKIVNGVKKGITSTQGLIAQGRGEAFDYLIGEKTTNNALLAEKTAAAMLLLAERPVISVNGNVAALVPEEIIQLGRAVNAPLEVNLFHRTQARVNKIIRHLRSLGAKNICKKNDALIPGIEHERAKADRCGILNFCGAFSATTPAISSSQYFISAWTIILPSAVCRLTCRMTSALVYMSPFRLPNLNSGSNARRANVSCTCCSSGSLLGFFLSRRRP